MVRADLGRGHIVSGGEADDSGCQCISGKVRTLVVVLQEVFKEGDHVVALTQDRPACNEAVNDSLKKEENNFGT
jgi:hypothetical protein